MRAALVAVSGRIARWARARWRSRRGRVLLAAVVVLALGVPSAFGFVLATVLGGDGGDGSPATRTATIGVLAPLSGELSADGTSVRNAVALAVDEANDDGAIPGWRLELSSRDDRSRPDGGAQAADAFAANDRLIGVVGPVSSLVARVAVPTLSAAGIPVVAPSTADPTLTGVGTGSTGTAAGGQARTRPYPTFFRLSGTDELQAQVAAEYAVTTLGRRRIAVVDGEPRYGTTLGDRFAAHATALGASVTAVYPTYADTDVDDVAASLEQEAPDLVYVTAGADFAGRLRARLAEAETSIQVLGTDALLRPHYTATAKTAADGDLITSLLVPPTRLPAAGAFVATYSQRYGGPADDQGGTTPSGASDGDSAGSADQGTEDGAAGDTSSAAAPAAAPTAGRAPGRPAAADPPDAASARQRQVAHDAAMELAQRRAAAIPAVAAYAYDAARAIIRAAAAVLPRRTAVDPAARRGIVTAIGRGTFAGVSGTVSFDRWGDIEGPRVVLYTVLGGRFVAMTTRTS
ncbi:branched-chain amino acid ABC transporter substrate-binding protein [Frankia sp. AgB32]|uniref:branched-chain amino acid ABC transporter substrate-binding protein n=1 Tax=Frankia sp. AgB32 TaxID=631119 RepID=UPI00200F1A7A|nr:branched-chain amino acid ABC transporter substrate-binding protein [Frankia sp. AgB32]